MDRLRGSRREGGHLKTLRPDFYFPLNPNMNHSLSIQFAELSVLKIFMYSSFLQSFITSQA